MNMPTFPASRELTHYPSADPTAEPWYAVNLTLLVPGLGQSYAGYVARGVSILIIQVSLLASGFWLAVVPGGFHALPFVLFLGAAIFYLWTLVDAYRCVAVRQAVRKEQTKGRRDLWLAVLLSQTLPGVGHVYVGWWLTGALFLAGSAVIVVALENTYVFMGVRTLYEMAACVHLYAGSTDRHLGTKNLLQKLLVLLLIVELFRAAGSYAIGLAGIRQYRVASASMAPTILEGDRVLARPVHEYHPARGDIVLFSLPLEPSRVMIKRIVALGGEIVEIRDGKLHINGMEVREQPFDRLSYGGDGEYGGPGNPYPVPKGDVFVLGDSIGKGLDSRYLGAIPTNMIVGRAYKILWPPARSGSIQPEGPRGRSRGTG